MQQFGLVTAITIALALLTSVSVLPALLPVWARRSTAGAATRPGQVGAPEQVSRPVG